MKKLLALSKDVQENNDVCRILRIMQFADEEGRKNVKGIGDIDNESQGICVVDFKSE